MDRICSALVNREISHGAFRLLVALTVARSQHPGGSDLLTVSREGLRAVLPGVSGREVTDSTVRHNLRELEAAGLVESYSSNAPKKVVLIHAKEPVLRVTPEEITSRVISRPGLGPDGQNV